MVCFLVWLLSVLGLLVSHNLDTSEPLEMTVAILKKIDLFLGVFVLWEVFDYLANKRCSKISKSISSATFFVYAAHVIILAAIYTIVLRYEFSDIAVTCIYLITPCIVISILVLVFTFLNKLAPKLMAVVCGNRN